MWFQSKTSRFPLCLFSISHTNCIVPLCLWPQKDLFWLCPHSHSLGWWTTHSVKHVCNACPTVWGFILISHFAVWLEWCLSDKTTSIYKNQAKQVSLHLKVAIKSKPTFLMFSWNIAVLIIKDLSVHLLLLCHQNL